MAKKLATQKRSEYQCPPKVCPNPADLRQFPSIMARVRAEWRNRMEAARSGSTKRRRAEAKAKWPGRKKARVAKR